MRRISWRLLFFVLNTLGLVLLLWRSGYVSPQELVVIRMTPSPDGIYRPDEVSEVAVEFGGLLDPGTIRADAIRLLPYVPGVVRLDGDRTVRMQLLKKLARATQYEVEVSPQVRGKGGEKPSTGRFFFATPSLSVAGVSQAKVEPDRSSILAIRFNSAVNPRALTNFLSIRDPKGHAISFQPVGGKPNSQVLVRIPRTEWEDLHLTIRKGLTGTEGPLPLREDHNADVKVVASLQFLGMKAEDDTEEDGVRVSKINVRMNSPVDVLSAGQFVVIDPAVKHTFESTGDGLEIIGDFKPARHYTVTLKTGLSAGAAGALVQDITRSVWFPDRGPNAGFPYGDGVLSSHGLLTVPIRSVNVKSVKLAIYRLYANNLVEYALRDQGDRFGDLGAPVKQAEVPIIGPKNEDTETLLRLDQLVPGNILGVYSLQMSIDDNCWGRDCIIEVVSDLGLSVRQAQGEVVVWVTSLTSGRPVPGCSVTMYSDKRQSLGMAVTDPDGVARIGIPPMPEGEKPCLLVAANAGDLNYLLISENGRDRGPETAEGRAYLRRGYEVFAFAERGIYRPGDTVRLSGFVRDWELARPESMPLNLVVTDPKGQVFLRKTVMTDSAGRVLTDVPVPFAALSGGYVASWRLPAKTHDLGSAEFRVADYIPQTLRLTVTAPDGRQPADRSLSVQVHVEHLFGGPAVGLKTRCAFRYSADAFAPEAWEKYKFGDDRKSFTPNAAESLPETKLDAGGNAAFELAPKDITSPAALRVEMEVQVLEEGGRAITEYFVRTLDPWPAYLGVRLPDQAVSAGRPAVLKLAAVRPDGKADPEIGAFTAKLSRVTYSNVLRKKEGRLVYDWTRQEIPESSQEGKLENGQTVLSITPAHPGSYRLIIESEAACPITFDFNADGPGAAWVSDDPEKVIMTLDKRAYKPGETASVRLKAPFAGLAFVTVEAAGILDHRLVELPKGEATVTLNVKEEYRPNAYVTATVIRPVRPEKDWQPHRASGLVRLKVDCADRKLDLQIASGNQVRPGQSITLAAKVLSDGRPQSGTAVVLIAVDEGTLALTKYATPSPWEYFYPLRRLDIQEFDIFSRLAPELAQWQVKRKLNPGGGGGDDSSPGADLGRRLNPIQTRRVKTAVLYAGALVTDAEGIARATFTLPEYIGELRVMAVAGYENRFGSVDKAVKVTSPIMAEAAWPRFLAPNDIFQVPVTIFNRTAKDKDARLNVAFTGPLALAAPVPAAVAIPNGGQQRVLLSVKATGVGPASARITVQADEDNYTESVDLPIRPAVTFARRGGTVTLEAGKPGRIAVEGRFLRGTAKAGVVIAGNPAVELAGVLRYLLEYPYGCVEQTTSKLVPLIYLGDLAKLADPGAVGKEEIDGLLAAGFLHLQMMQAYSGGLSAWPGDAQEYPWGSVYAADVLIEAQKAGYEVPKTLTKPLLDYISQHVNEWATAREECRPTQITEAAYACYVLVRAGEPPYAWLASLEETIRDADAKTIAIPTTARFYLAAAYLAAGQAKAGKDLISGTYPVVATRETCGCLDSPIREAAIKLLVLLDIDPESPQVPALAENLRRNARLGSLTTQEGAFTLMALGKLARRTGVASEGEVTVTLPNGSKKAFNAREGWQADNATPGQALDVSFQGKGKLHAFWYAEGVPVEGTVKEEDSGLTVRRTFCRVDGKTPVRTDEFRQGELYQVVLTIRSRNPLDNLVITDLLPAGLEPADVGLKGSRAFVAKDCSAMVIDHVEPRDDRVLIFAHADANTAEYRYLVRAVTAGEFVLPAVEASCMYDPAIYSVHGRAIAKVHP